MQIARGTESAGRQHYVHQILGSIRRSGCGQRTCGELAARQQHDAAADRSGAAYHCPVTPVHVIPVVKTLFSTIGGLSTRAEVIGLLKVSALLHWTEVCSRNLNLYYPFIHSPDAIVFEGPTNYNQSDIEIDSSNLISPVYDIDVRINLPEDCPAGFQKVGDLCFPND
ncbi:unnamed protein product [Leptidea sinapis]|uniref:Uncharacterized protein n=1 Tax=Leptidea sinapis TaxID=189913 RepID=A0A5E4QPA6_9NEOP|nr:unnamed protein product [Leptidea sinapis]